MSATVKLFHAVVFALYITVAYDKYTLSIGSNASDTPKIKFLRRFVFRFLTNWTYGVQLIYFGSCILSYCLDTLSFRKFSYKVKSFGNIIFTTIVIPIGFFITICFWAIYNTDRELVYPKGVDKVIAVWVNHSVHTLNSVLPFLDMCLVNHKFPPWLLSLAVISTYLLAYLICIGGTYIQTGFWLYPFIAKLTWPQRGIFCALSIAIIILVHAAARVFSKLYWGFFEAVPQLNNNKQKTIDQDIPTISAKIQGQVSTQVRNL